MAPKREPGGTCLQKLPRYTEASRVYQPARVYLPHIATDRRGPVGWLYLQPVDGTHYNCQVEAVYRGPFCRLAQEPEVSSRRE